MTTVRTSLGWKEDARRWRFEPAGNVTGTSVQTAIQQVDTEAAGKLSPVATARLPVSAASVPILFTDIEVGIDTSTTAVGCLVPLATSWAGVNRNGLELTIFDYTGNAATHNITVTLTGSDVFVQGVPVVISSAYGQVKLRPIGASWYVRAFS
jgi:hypothetical protein